MAHKQLVEVCNLAETTKVAQVPSCAGTLDNKPVDSVVGAYLLNQENKHTERVYDVALAQMSGNAVVSTAGTFITVALTTVAVTNDAILKFVIDWGNGFTDTIDSASSSVANFVNQPIGKYEAKIYGVMRSGNVLSLGSFEFNWNDPIITTITPVNQLINRNYSVKVGEALQNYCNGVLVGTPYNANGTAYTATGTIRLLDPVLRDERFSIADVTLAGSALTPPIVVPLENASPNSIVGALANAITIVPNPPFTGARDVTVYNGKNVTVAFEYTTTINGVFHRINVPAGGTWSNTLKRDDYTNEGTYVASRIVTAYGATTAANEININWTT